MKGVGDMATVMLACLGDVMLELEIEYVRGAIGGRLSMMKESGRDDHDTSGSYSMVCSSSRENVTWWCPRKVGYATLSSPRLRKNTLTLSVDANCAKARTISRFKGVQMSRWLFIRVDMVLREYSDSRWCWPVAE